VPRIPVRVVACRSGGPARRTAAGAGGDRPPEVNARATSPRGGSGRCACAGARVRDAGSGERGRGLRPRMRGQSGGRPRCGRPRARSRYPWAAEPAPSSPRPGDRRPPGTGPFSPASVAGAVPGAPRGRLRGPRRPRARPPDHGRAARCRTGTRLRWGPRFVHPVWGADAPNGTRETLREAPCGPPACGVAAPKGRRDGRRRRNASGPGRPSRPCRRPRPAGARFVRRAATTPSLRRC